MKVSEGDKGPLLAALRGFVRLGREKLEALPREDYAALLWAVERIEELEPAPRHYKDGEGGPVCGAMEPYDKLTWIAIAVTCSKCNRALVKRMKSVVAEFKEFMA